MTNGTAALNAAFRFRSEIVSSLLYLVLLSFSRRAAQIIVDANKKETFYAADPIAASCLSKIAPCTTSSCDTVAAVLIFHLRGKLGCILIIVDTDKEKTLCAAAPNVDNCLSEIVTHTTSICVGAAALSTSTEEAS